MGKVILEGDPVASCKTFTEILLYLPWMYLWHFVVNSISLSDSGTADAL